MNKQILLLPFFLLICYALKTYAQCPTTMLPDTICAGEPFDITGTTSGFQDYYWDFCTGDLNNSPLGTNIGNPGGNLNSSHQIDIVEENGNYYGFVTNSWNNNISRLDFGNSPANTPVLVPVTASLLNTPTGIQLLKENNNWFALVQNYGNSGLIRLDFGPSITNVTPSDVALGQLGLVDPFHLKIIRLNNNIYAFSANQGGGNIKRLDFGNSILNNPSENTITDPSFSGPFGIDIIYDCDLDKFIGTLTNQTSGTISILDFGNHLENTPVVTSLTNLPLTSPTSVNILRDNFNWHVLITDQNGIFNQLDFGSNLLTVPSIVYSDTLGYLSTPRGLKFINFESTWYGFIINWSGSITKVIYPDTCSQLQSYSDSINPSGILMSQPGTFTIQLAATNNDGLIYYFNESVLVLESPTSQFDYLQNICDNLITFYDSSFTNSGTIVSWQWDFGDGNTSNLQNPIHSYTIPGNFNVELTVTTSTGCASTSQKSVYNSKPSASFTVNDGCIVPPMTFSNTSPDPQNQITSWLWDFGDSNSSFLENPVHSYINPGVYNVYLVASIGNCTDTAFTTVTYQSKPDIQFSVSNTCLNQQQLFNNNTTIATGSIIAYNWNFDDGNFSSLINPIHQYSDTGNYSVSLIAEASNGCIDTLTKVIRVSLQPSANFSYTPANLCSGSPISFQDNSTLYGDSASQWFWNFDNGDTSIFSAPVHSYPFPGQYDVTLIITAGTNCLDSITQSLIILPSPTVSFIASTVCFGDTTEFTDQSSTVSGNITQWYWNFGVDTSTNQNPGYLFSNSGNFPIELTVVSDLGCSSTDTMFISVSPLPISNFYIQNSCSNKLTQFIDLSTIFSGNINTWSWDFGDPGSGSNNFSTSSNPQHNYNLPGNYNVILVVVSDMGCTDSIEKLVSVARTPNANFSASQTCDGEHVVFTYLDNAFPSNATNWFWDFGNGATSTIENPATLYLFWGTYNITLIVSDSISGCSDTIIKPIDVDPNPIAIISENIPCVGVPYTMSDSSVIATGTIQLWQWTIESETYMIQNPVHVFPDTGQYLVSLFVTSDKGCKDSTSKTIEISGLPEADFSFSPEYGDAPLQVNFLNNSNEAHSYLWYFGDGSSSVLTNPQHVYSDTGIFIITLIAINEFGCIDSLQKSIYIVQPIIDLAIVKLIPVIDNNYVSISAEIYNFGTREVNSFVISSKLAGLPGIVEKWFGSLKSGEVMTYQFNASLEIMEDLSFICVAVFDPNGEKDNNPSNNERCISFKDNLEILSIYPNPTNDHFTIQFNSDLSTELLIEIFDSKGKLIRNLFKGEVTKGFNSVSFSSKSENITNGTYKIRIRAGDKSSTSKLIKH